MQHLSGALALRLRPGDADWTDGRKSQPMEEPFQPMLACPGRLPRDDSTHGYEVKWDGVRAIAYVADGRLRLTGPSGADFTPRYPELGAVAEQTGSRGMVLDG